MLAFLLSLALIVLQSGMGINLVSGGALEGVCLFAKPAGDGGWSFIVVQYYMIELFISKIRNYNRKCLLLIASILHKMSEIHLKTIENYISLWQNQRLFFPTPEILQLVNDMGYPAGIFCFVFDFL